MSREARAVARVLRRRGALMTFVLRRVVTDKATGTQAPQELGTVQALAAVLPMAASVDHQVDEDATEILVEGAPFAAAALGDLDEDWLLVLPTTSARVAINGPVRALRTAPGTPAAFFTARLTSGEGA